MPSRSKYRAKGLIISIRLPIRVQSEMNLREHWRARQKRAKTQKECVRKALNGQFRDVLRMPVLVRFIRLGKRLLDSDNLQGSFKHIRDAVAGWVGVDDRDARYIWDYQQEIAKEYSVRIEIIPQLRDGDKPELVELPVSY